MFRLLIEIYTMKDVPPGLRGIILWDAWVRSAYTFYCKLLGREARVPRERYIFGRCLLATKYVENLYNKVFGGGRDCTPTVLELYELQCPGRPGYGSLYFRSRHLRKLRCERCQRALEIRGGDKLVE